MPWSMPAVALACLLPMYFVGGLIVGLLNWQPERWMSSAPLSAGALVIARWYDFDVPLRGFLGMVGVAVLSLGFPILLTDVDRGWFSALCAGWAGAAVGCYAFALATRIHGRP